MNKTAIYAGTFDPLTLGHLDVIERAARIFERLIITLAINPAKKPFFSVDERQEMIVSETQRFENVEVDSFDGLLVDYVRSKGSMVIVRGLRAFSDFEYEFQMALTNRQLAKDVETIFLMPNQNYSYLNSRNVRQIAALGGATDEFVPASVSAALKKKFEQGS